MRTLSVLCCAYLGIMLAGCAGSISPSQLEPPAKALMQPPPKLAEPKAGDDLIQSHLALRRQYATETGKLARLQRYIRTVLGTR